MVSGGKCAPYYLPSTPVAGRCIPQVLTDVAGYASQEANQFIVVIKYV